MKGIFVVIGIALFVYFGFFLDADGQMKAKGEKVVKKEEVEEVVILSNNDQNDNVVKSFLTELMGNDYELLINLVSEDSFDIDINALDEEEFDQFAKSIGNGLKENKQMTSGRITQIERNDGFDNYSVVLLFSDDTSRILNLRVENGLINIPLAELIAPQQQ